MSCKGGEGEERGEGDWESKGRGQAADELRLGFLNCRGWHSREVDVKMMLGKLDLDVMGLAETFLRREEEIEVGGYMWHGQNRQYCKRASGGVRLLVKKHLKVLPLRSQTEGVVWVEVRLEKERKLAVGVVYINPEGVRVENTEKQFEGMQEEISRLQQKGFSIVLMGDFNPHIGLGEEQSPNRNGQKLLNVVWACDLRVGNELPECMGRWTWESGEKRSVVDYILVSREMNVHRMIIEDEGAVELGSVRPQSDLVCNWTVQSRESDTRREV